MCGGSVTMKLMAQVFRARSRHCEEGRRLPDNLVKVAGGRGVSSSSLQSASYGSGRRTPLLMTEGSGSCLCC